MKQLLSEKVFQLTNELKIPRKTVKELLSAFIFYKKLEVLSGKEISIKGLVNIVPEPLIDSGISTLGYTAKVLAREYNIPYNSVFTILNRFIDIQMEQLRMGNPVDFRGIVKIKPIIENDIIKAIHSSVSVSLTTDVGWEENISSCRVYTSKLLKQNLIGTRVEKTDIELIDDLEEVQSV